MSDQQSSVHKEQSSDPGGCGVKSISDINYLIFCVAVGEIVRGTSSSESSQNRGSEVSHSSTGCESNGDSNCAIY